ncbi:hypothetical protein GCM10023082_12900 [Streptomyces tremellae]|uniref:LysR substrate-binding domain-containing protein n=1 Tax=Streptomyces tremellae TaxID=1124239 RepID=A0ABP7EB08_9ACTN
MCGRDGAGRRRPSRTPGSPGHGAFVVEEAAALPVVRQGGQPDGDRGTLLALGRTLLVIPASSRAWQCPEHVAVPVVDAPEVTAVVAWPASSRSRAVAALVRAAAGLADAREPDLRERDARELNVRGPDLRGPDAREADARGRDAREADARERDVRESGARTGLPEPATRPGPARLNGVRRAATAP